MKPPSRSRSAACGPYQAHAPFAPNCALADIRADGGLVICSSQDVYAARRSIAQLLGLPPEQLRVQYARRLGHLRPQLL